MTDIKLTTYIVDGKITFPYQNEVENLALETIGSSENIFFEKIPITKDLYIEYSDTEKSWILQQSIDAWTLIGEE